jgi:hypothetical protein
MHQLALAQQSPTQQILEAAAEVAVVAGVGMMIFVTGVVMQNMTIEIGEKIEGRLSFVVMHRFAVTEAASENGMTGIEEIGIVEAFVVGDHHHPGVDS